MTKPFQHVPAPLALGASRPSGTRPPQRVASALPNWRDSG